MITPASASVRPTCLVTGASAGIGAATVLEIARRGYDVGLTGRDASRLEEVAQQCRAVGAVAHTYAVDVSSLAAVRGLAERVLQDFPRLDVLVNNAGVVVQKRSETGDGFETMFAVNHLAPYLLTRLLSDRLVESAPSRVVVVASDAYKFGDLHPDDYGSTGDFKPMKVYGRSKLANLLFAAELSRRLEGQGVAVSAVHPGFVSTSLGRDNRLAAVVLRLLKPFIRTPEKGARTSIELATRPLGAAGGGRYHVDGKVKDTGPRGTDREMAARLWSDSARMVGLDD